MAAVNSPRWYHANRYNAKTACSYCEGVVRHAAWCPLCNPAMAYAYSILDDAGLLTMADRLILHALGVAWM